MANLSFQSSTLATVTTTVIVATDNLAGVSYQRVKIAQGDTGTATDVSSIAPLWSSLTTSTAMGGSRSVIPTTQWTVSVTPTTQFTVTTTPSSNISVAPSSQWTVTTTPSSQITASVTPSSQFTVSTTPTSQCPIMIRDGYKPPLGPVWHYFSHPPWARQ